MGASNGLASPSDVDGDDSLMQLFGFSGADLDGFNNPSWFEEGNAIQVRGSRDKHERANVSELAATDSRRALKPNCVSRRPSLEASKSVSSLGRQQVSSKRDAVGKLPQQKVETKGTSGKAIMGPSRSEKRRLDDHSRFMYRRIDQVMH